MAEKPESVFAPERPRKLPKPMVDAINQISAHRSERVRDTLAAAARAAVDIDEANRVRARKCGFCFYLDRRIAGQTFTQWTCSLCGARDEHSNTAVPKLCAGCSDAFSLCVSCMGDLAMRHRAAISVQKGSRR